MPPPPVVAARVKAALRDRGLSQRELAEATGLEVTKLSKSLGGRRRFLVDELRRAADVLDVDLGWLTGEGDDTPPAVAPAGLTALAHDLYTGTRGRQRRAVVEAAWVLIADRGHASVRLSDVAARCGIDEAEVAGHFASARELLDETLRLAAQQAYERQHEALGGLDDGLRRLRRLIELQLPTPGAVDREWSIWLQVWAQAAIDPTIRALHEQAYVRWLTTVRSAIELAQQQGTCRVGDAQEMAARLTALVDGLGLQLVTGRAGRTPEMVDAAIEDHLRAHVLATTSSAKETP
ncbi:TetR family transcriptional regulator C-terminal domain-containing protein [Aeromicrobium sp. CTD01-1L150]|uniref:TetR family transcriptional regulator C-terminal domain-containing protein n=1 Tax=Aeromicrobium sp. CTD01-1L150 TaxID=3341830 RepID=UPI0035C1C350